MRTIDKIRDFIAKGETEKAVELLVQYTKENKPTLQKEAVLLSSRFQQWKRSVTIGINESSNDLRHIENNILTLLEDTPTEEITTTVLAEETTTTEPKTQSAAPISPPQKSSNWMPVVIGLLGLGALLMVGFWMFGNDHHSDDHSHDKTTLVPDKTGKTDKTNQNDKGGKKADTTPTPTPQPEPPKQKLPKINGKNVNLVEVDAGFYYRHMGNKNWLETNKKTFKNKNHFVETARDDYSVYLYDKAREVSMQIDLYRKKMTYADPNTKKRDQFNVVNKWEKAKALQMIKVEYDKGYFEIKEGKTWEEKNKATNKVIDSFTETARDENSVYLTNNAKDIRLDLYLNKVMYNQKGKTLAPLYGITKVY